MPIQPLYDKVVVRRDASVKKTVGGIVLPGKVDELNQGTVVAVGPGKRVEGGIERLTVKVGDKVIFGVYSTANKVTVDGEELLVMSEPEILGLITEAQ